jgi:hypothetical protein
LGIRQKLNEKPAITVSVVGLLTVAAIGFLIWQFTGRGQRAHGHLKAFYSDDDGKTYFTDEGYKLTPFTDANGKEAVQAIVFKCGAGEPFVGYLMRYDAESKRIMDQSAQTSATAHKDHANGMLMLEVKKPREKNWVKFDPKNPKPYTEVMSPTCPGGGKDGPRPVSP